MSILLQQRGLPGMNREAAQTNNCTAGETPALQKFESYFALGFSGFPSNFSEIIVMAF